MTTIDNMEPKREYDQNYAYGRTVMVEEGSIPPILDKMTLRVLAVHHTNGDLGYIKDLIKDIEAGTICL